MVDRDCSNHWLILLHYVVLYSQNVKLCDACEDGDVSRVSELISKGAQVNYHNPDDDNVSTIIVVT